MRKEKSIKNFITSIIPYVIILLLGFLRVNLFIKFLGEEIYALNTLFYQIFIYLSLAEAGAGTYIVQLYYKYFATDNKQQIINIYCSAKNILKKIAFTIFVIGLGVSFFLKIFTNNNLSLLYMQIVFTLFLLKNVVDYLMMAPKSVIEADQKVYKINFRFYLMKIFEYIIDILCLYLGFNYVILLLGEIVTRFLTYFVTNKRIYREYPWLKNKPTEKVELKGIGSVFWHRISEAIHYNTDIIITSSFLSPLLVTIYSSYNYITKYLTDIIDIMSSSISPSFGNSLYKDAKDNMLKIFEEINVVFLFIAAFLSTMVYVLGNSFVGSIWLGNKYIIDDLAFVFLIVNFFIVIARKPLNIYRNSKGLFKETKIIVLLEAIVNLILSLLLVSKYGISGILIATTVSMITTTLWYLPFYIYKKDLNIPVYKYYVRLGYVFLITILITIILYEVINMLNITNLILWIIAACACGIISLIIYFFIFYLSFREFRELKNKGFEFIRRRKVK